MSYRGPLMADTAHYFVIAVPAAVALALAGILGYWVRHRQDKSK